MSGTEASTLDIRRLTEGDIAAALRLSTQAGWNQLDADWRRLLALWPDNCLAGWAGGRLVATATLATYGERLGWVGMILVDEEHRRRGFGGAMVDAIIARAEEVGVRVIGLDATDMGEPVYARRGFRPVGRINRWRGPASRPETAEQCPRIGPTDWPQVLRLDLMASCVPRGMLLEALAAESGASARVAYDSGRAAAYGIVRPGRTAAHIGPVAGESSRAVPLLMPWLMHDAARLCDAGAGGPDRAVFIDVPEGSPLEPWLTEHGLTISRRLVRMLRATTTVPVFCQSHIFAAAGFELG